MMNYSPPLVNPQSSQKWLSQPQPKQKHTHQPYTSFTTSLLISYIYFCKIRNSGLTYRSTVNPHLLTDPYPPGKINPTQPTTNPTNQLNQRKRRQRRLGVNLEPGVLLRASVVVDQRGYWTERPYDSVKTWSLENIGIRTNILGNGMWLVLGDSSWGSN